MAEDCEIPGEIVVNDRPENPGLPAESDELEASLLSFVEELEAELEEEIAQQAEEPAEGLPPAEEAPAEPDPNMEMPLEPRVPSHEGAGYMHSDFVGRDPKKPLLQEDRTPVKREKPAVSLYGLNQKTEKERMSLGSDLLPREKEPGLGMEDFPPVPRTYLILEPQAPGGLLPLKTEQGKTPPGDLSFGHLVMAPLEMHPDSSKTAPEPLTGTTGSVHMEKETVCEKTPLKPKPLAPHTSLSMNPAANAAPFTKGAPERRRVAAPLFKGDARRAEARQDASFNQQVQNTKKESPMRERQLLRPKKPELTKPGKPPITQKEPEPGKHVESFIGSEKPRIVKPEKPPFRQKETTFTESLEASQKSKETNPFAPEKTLLFSRKAPAKQPEKVQDKPKQREWFVQKDSEKPRRAMNYMTIKMDRTRPVGEPPMDTKVKTSQPSPMLKLSFDEKEPSARLMGMDDLKKRKQNPDSGFHM